MGVWRGSMGGPECLTASLLLYCYHLFFHAGKDVGCACGGAQWEAVSVLQHRSALTPQTRGHTGWCQHPAPVEKRDVNGKDEQGKLQWKNATVNLPATTATVTFATLTLATRTFAVAVLATAVEST